MKLIVGLGNPGSRYAKTRHNIGRRAVEALASGLKVKWREGKNLKSQYTQIDQGEDSFILVVPNLFMNESGKAVRALVDHFEVNSDSDLLIITDDAALPLGRLRLRAKGTDGGHRGLRSIEKALGSRNYARLRIGIAPHSPARQSLEEYVLSPFKKEEEIRLKEILKRSVSACNLWLTQPMEKAMDWANQPTK